MEKLTVNNRDGVGKIEIPGENIILDQNRKQPKYWDFMDSMDLLAKNSILWVAQILIQRPIEEALEA